MTDPIALSGAPGSPYTRKMLAVLRYRRIPYHYMIAGSAALDGLPRAKVPLLPTFYLPDEAGELRAVTDSTPLIRRLERDHAGRSVVPTDPALAFLDELLEDFADEWLTKAMFHYRWSYAPDIDKAAKILPAWRGFSIADGDLAADGAFVAERQIGRLRYVGSNAVTGPLIEAGYRRFLDAFEAHLRSYPYVLGGRPSSCDFATFGQLSQLAEFDPTPAALTLQVAPRVSAWTGIMEDQSGAEPDGECWFSVSDPPATLTALLAEMGRGYAPVMLANARAVRDKASEVIAEVDGVEWRQQPFPYQAKCLIWLQESRAALNGDGRDRIDPLLAAAGLTPLFS